jgi:hypothetical protein
MASNMSIDDPALKHDLIELLDTLESFLDDEYESDQQFVSLMYKKMYRVRDAFQLDGEVPTKFED